MHSSIKDFQEKEKIPPPSGNDTNQNDFVC